MAGDVQIGHDHAVSDASRSYSQPIPSGRISAVAPRRASPCPAMASTDELGTGLWAVVVHWIFVNYAPPWGWRRWHLRPNKLRQRLLQTKKLHQRLLQTIL